MAGPAKTARKRMAKASTVKARPAHARAKARGGPRGVGASGGQRDLTRLLEQIVHQNNDLAGRLDELTLAIRNRAEGEVLSNG